MVLVDDAARPGFEELFGNPDEDYQAAIDRHYSQGAPEGWQNFVSSYDDASGGGLRRDLRALPASRDTLTPPPVRDGPGRSTLDSDLPGDAASDRIVEWWLPLSWALNQINRSMGHPDMYPFVLAGPVSTRSVMCTG